MERGFEDLGVGGIFVKTCKGLLPLTILLEGIIMCLQKSSPMHGMFSNLPLFRHTGQ